ncbi:uncharacterized protein [Rutidosis leptorrhynchoides]|uniref:uncharacterized protein n=1 Tax=Rutidosis leptorrhynchoides TaxID=125765 RepID=UPI003A99B48A
MAAVKWLWDRGEISPDCNASFITSIPKIKDPSAYLKGRSILESILIANEVVADVKKSSSKCFLFKSDFEKAFDSVKWKFLFDSMTNMGFGAKWIKWIKSCFSLASVSVLVNGSPTKEFSLH